MITLLVVFLAGARSEAIFTVNSTADATDANPGDGVCETAAGNGVCTLRAAVMETNILAGSHVIVIPAGVYTLTIPGQDDDAAVGDLDIKKSLEIQGAGANTTIVDGGQLDRVFDVRTPSGQTITMSGFTIRNGSTADWGGNVCNCTAGSILILASIVITDSFYAHSGGGVANFGLLTVQHSVIASNTARFGAGIYNDDQSGQGVASITDSTIFGNIADGDGSGGGIWNSGTMTVTRTTINGNMALQPTFGGVGGGIVNGGTMVIINSTLSQNSAGSNGGGIFNGGVISLTNTTIVSNTAPVGSGLRNLDGAVEVKNVIVANNAATNCTASTVPITSHGHNLENGNTCNFTGPGDLINTDPLLGPLQDNGGPTLTHALLAGSPAIDAGDNVGCPPIDQRGAPRPIDGGSGSAICDIGAYEYNATVPTPTPTITPTMTPTPSVTPTPTSTPESEPGLYLPIIRRDGP